MTSPTADPSMAVIGKSQPRVDGPLKVTGSAKYTSDHGFPGMLYAVPVGATVASGTIEAIDTARARQMPGVRSIRVGFTRRPPLANIEYAVTIRMTVVSPAPSA